MRYAGVIDGVDVVVRRDLDSLRVGRDYFSSVRRGRLRVSWIFSEDLDLVRYSLNDSSEFHDFLLINQERLRYVPSALGYFRSFMPSVDSNDAGLALLTVANQGYKLCSEIVNALNHGKAREFRDMRGEFIPLSRLVKDKPLYKLLTKLKFGAVTLFPLVDFPGEFKVHFFRNEIPNAPRPPKYSRRILSG